MPARSLAGACLAAGDTPFTQQAREAGALWELKS